MRKDLIMSIIGGAIMFALLCGIAVTSKSIKTKNTIYALTTEVVAIDNTNDLVTCKDSDDNLWRFYGTEDWTIGDCASLLMDNNKTPDDVRDDTVINAHYDTLVFMH